MIAGFEKLNRVHYMIVNGHVVVEYGKIIITCSLFFSKLYIVLGVTIVDK
jgi:hypothetical protein